MLKRLWNKQDLKLNCQAPRLALKGRLLILHEGVTPTLHYFLAAFTARAQGLTVVLVDTTQVPHVGQLPRAGDKVLIIRFIPPRWQRFLLPALSGVRVVWFIDDDLLDADSWQELPTTYRDRLQKKQRQQRGWLQRHCHRLWVSTPHLQQKYRDMSPVLVAPQASQQLLRQASTVRIAYHGTASHQQEKEWLFEVMQAVLPHYPQATFEIFGDHEVYRRYRHLPQVVVLHPMSWENYLHYTRTHGADIGLAPLLDSSFNRARAATKYFDFVRLGAAGLFSNRAPYRDLVQQNLDGLLLENQPELWARAIGRLIELPHKRQQLITAAQVQAPSVHC